MRQAANHRLIVFAPSYFPMSGGVETHIRAVTKSLSRQGWATTIFVRYAPGIPARQVVDGATVLRMPRENSRIEKISWLVRYTGLLMSAEAIHSHDYFPLWVRRAVRSRRWVHTFHGYEGYPLDPGAIASRQNVMKNIDASIGVGKFIEKWYHTACDYWIYGAVDEADIPEKQPPQWDIVFYGRLEADTGIETYLAGYRLILKTHPHTSMAVIGSGSLEKRLVEYAREHKLPVEFWPSRPGVLSEVSKAKMAFVSGYLSIIESAALGLPLVAVYDTPIKKDYLESHPMAQNFYITSSPEGVAEAYQKILEAPDTGIETFRIWARQQTWDSVARLYAKTYKV